MLFFFKKNRPLFNLINTSTEAVSSLASRICRKDQILGNRFALGVSDSSFFDAGQKDHHPAKIHRKTAQVPILIDEGSGENDARRLGTKKGQDSKSVEKMEKVIFLR